MDEKGERRVRAKSSGDKIDRLSNLPESLLCEVLLNLPTKDVVKTMCFLDFNSESCVHKFELKDNSWERKYEWKWYHPDIAHITQWIDTVIKRKVQHLHFLDNPLIQLVKDVEIPLTVYTCESLVSLRLCEMVLLNPKSVSLPSLKVMYLDSVMFANDWAFERLVSGCSVLERLTVKRSVCNNVKALRVCSQSLLRFKLFRNHDEDYLDEDLVVVIDAPRLEKLKLDDHETASCVINHPVSLVKVDIDVMFNRSQFDPNDLAQRNTIRNFLLGISSVKDMVIT